MDIKKTTKKPEVELSLFAKDPAICFALGFHLGALNVIQLPRVHASSENDIGVTASLSGQFLSKCPVGRVHIFQKILAVRDFCAYCVFITGASFN